MSSINKPSKFWRISVLSPLKRPFDYLPAEGAPVPLPGARVKVPFGRSTRLGIFLKGLDETDVPPNKLKRVEALLDEQPLFSEGLYKMMLWASQYYHTPMAEVAMSGLPTALRQGKPLPMLPVIEDIVPQPSQHDLSEAQASALSILNLSAERSVVHLLVGVTGSGKTEVYLQALEQILMTGGQGLVLVPEISLTPQTVRRFKARFGDGVYCYHSQMTPKQRLDTWLATKTERPLVVIGTRSAVFLPLTRLKLIVVDEEHDAAFKQQEGFRYHARDLCVLRAHQANIPCVLGSATPSFESLQNVTLGRYQRHDLPYRVGESQLPQMHILDIRHKKLEGGLSAQLLAAIKKTLADKEQVLIFLNRRGYAPVWMCFECHWMAMCKRCDARMTYHRQAHRLRCHHCDARQAVSTACPECQAELSPMGQGTEQLEECLTTLFPQACITRIDSDVTRKKGALAEKLESVRSGESDILIGTQLLAKGHHFPKLSMVAIVDCDGGLFSADFRASERMGQLITQVSGRAGRQDLAGHVWLQTHQMDHPLLQVLIQKGYLSFAETLLKEREQAMLPPFAHMALLRCEAHHANQLDTFLIQLKDRLLQTASPVHVLGPVPAPMAKRAGKHRAQLMLLSPERPALHACITRLFHEIAIGQATSSAVRWSLDVDPIETF